MDQLRFNLADFLSKQSFHTYCNYLECVFKKCLKLIKKKIRCFWRLGTFIKHKFKLRVTLKDMLLQTQNSYRAHKTDLIEFILHWNGSHKCQTHSDNIGGNYAALRINTAQLISCRTFFSVVSFIKAKTRLQFWPPPYIFTPAFAIGWYTNKKTNISLKYAQWFFRVFTAYKLIEINYIFL